MKKTAQVMEIMKKNVIAVGISDNLREAKDSFSESKCRHLPVMHGGRLMGMLHSADIPSLSQQDVANSSLALFQQSHTEKLGVNKFVKPLPTSVSSTDSLDQVAKIFCEDDLTALPVIDNGKLVGIITVSDVIEYLLAN